MTTFTVTAGNFDGVHRDVRHNEKHESLEAAIADHEKHCEIMAWSRIELRDGIHIYEITPKRVRVKDGIYFVDCTPDGKISEFI